MVVKIPFILVLVFANNSYASRLLLRTQSYKTELYNLVTMSKLCVLLHQSEVSGKKPLAHDVMTYDVQDENNLHSSYIQ